MAASNKAIKLNRYNLNGNKKKTGINLWRCFFNGVEKTSGAESMFFIEVELLNPQLSPDEPLLGFKPRITIKEDDLQYALAGTSSAQNIKSENIVQPSYVVLRAGKMGMSPKQVCSYYSLKELKLTMKPFSLLIGNKLFTDDKLSGFINIQEAEHKKHPEYLCDSGYVTWNLNYEIIKDFCDGYQNKTDKWFPYGIKTSFTGSINFDGEEYLVEPRKCYGYMDRYWGKTYPEEWFHISSSSLSSIISGKNLFDSSFSIQGNFENKVSFMGVFEGSEIMFCANSRKRSYSTVWNCSQTPESDTKSENRLHWSVSINNKNWVIDVDLYCRIDELYDRKLELPEGERRILNVIQGGTGVGEIKLFKRVKKTLEQIEYAKITKAVCEFGHIEPGEI